MMNNIPQGVLEIIRTLRNKGFVSYLVGGCVRDMLLEREPKDYDVVTNATPEQIKDIFPKTVLVGEAFGVVRVLIGDEDVEVATFRSDGKYNDGRHPEGVTFSTPENDVERRDFTINAMLYDPIEDKVLDYVGGHSDVENGLIRTVGNPSKRFAEDRLRMLRAIRFLAQLDFHIDDETAQAIQDSASSIFMVSKERITQELAKIWRSENPGSGFFYLKILGLLEHVIPYSNVESGWSTISRAFDELGNEPTSPDDKEIIGWALTLMPFESNHPSKFIDERLRSCFRLTNPQIKKIMALHESRDVFREGNLKSAYVTKLLLSPDAKLFIAFQKIVNSWSENHPRVLELNAIMNDLKTNPIPLDQIPRGNDLLDKFQGQELGKILKASETAILERRAFTRETAISTALKEIEDEKSQIRN